MASHKIVWERSNKHGKWFPYSADICNYLEENLKKKNVSVCLGDVDEDLKIYSVNLKEFFQVSEVTGTKLPVRRRRCDSLSVLGRGFSWQWLDDHNVWNDYDADVNDFIDIAFLEGKQSVSLSKKFPGYPYEIVFSKMLQINKRSKRKRKVRRADQTSSYPDETLPAEDSIDEDLTAASAPPFQAPAELDPNVLAQEIPGTEDLLSQVNAYRSNVLSSEHVAAVLSGRIEGADAALQNQNERNFNVEQSSSLPPTTVALVNGRPWLDHRPPHTPRSKLKPVPGIEPLPMFKKPKKKKKRGAEETCPEEKLSPLERYTEVIDLSLELSKEDCVICFSPLSDNSAYNDDKTVVKLTLCAHVFHKGCIEAMYNSGKKEFLQCPFCKTNHGEKHGMQPPGEMIYHVLPYSLPGYPENDTIRIIYDIPPGIQGPEHPNPGKHYTARGFPRHCYLPDNEMGRKILRLLIKAWNRRLIFTIGRSSTTGEENTVTWNEIHHKTEFGCNRRGHGYPDPNYFYNVLAELEAHGVIDDEVRVWCPA